MKKHLKNSRGILTFSKLSRKSYAIFVSLHKVVRIACLKVETCDLALRKSGSIRKNLNFLFKNEPSSQVSIEDLLKNSALEKNAISELLLSGIRTLSPATPSYPSHYTNNTIHQSP